MAVATTNYTDIAYVLETVPGTINTSPAFKLLPTTGGTPASTITTAQSEAIRSDRQTPDLIKVDSELKGDLNYELDFPNYSPLVEALMQQDTTGTAVSETGLTYTDATSKLGVAASGIDGIVEIGDVIFIEFPSDNDPDTGNPYFASRVVIDNTTTDEITFAPALPTDWASTVDGATDVTVKYTKTITNGADTPKQYSFRKRVIIGSSIYSYYSNGCMINTMNFNFSTASILNGSFGITGLTESIQTSTSPTPGLSGETTVDAEAYTIMNSISSVAAIYIEGMSMGRCSFNSMDLTIDNQINLAKSIGVEGACDSAAFSLQIMANVNAFFANLDLYNAFLNSTGFSVTIIVEDADNNVFGLNMPYCKFESLDVPISGRDQFLNQTGSLKALMHPTLGYMMKVTLIDASA